jgi:hypothetical protein
MIRSALALGWAVGMLALAMLLLAGGDPAEAASMAEFRETCTQMGYPEGSPDHAACTERELSRWRQAQDAQHAASSAEWNAIIQQAQEDMRQALQPPRTCVWQRTRTGFYQQCY